MHKRRIAGNDFSPNDTKILNKRQKMVKAANDIALRATAKMGKGSKVLHKQSQETSNTVIWGRSDTYF